MGRALKILSCPTTTTQHPPHPQQASALEEDGAQRREDAAKKRAVRTARSYDEFRHRVACAHLKPLRSAAALSVWPGVWAHTHTHTHIYGNCPVHPLFLCMCIQPAGH